MLNSLNYSVKLFIKIRLLNLLINFLPVRKSDDNSYGICTLLCHRDVDKFIYAIESFFYFSGNVYPLYIVNDGSLTSDDAKIISRLFTAKIVSVKNTEKRMKSLLKKYPRLLALRFSKESAVYKYKLDALLLNPFKKIMFLDADILTQRNPREITDWINGKTENMLYTVHNAKFFKQGFYPEFAFRNLLYRHYKTKMDPAFSSGILLTPSKKFLNLNLLEKAAGILERLYWSNSPGIDETLLSLYLSLSAGSKSEVLGKSYYIMALNEQYNKTRENNAVIIHYGYHTKSRFYQKAFELVVKTKMFGIKIL